MAESLPHRGATLSGSSYYHCSREAQPTERFYMSVRPRRQVRRYKTLYLWWLRSTIHRKNRPCRSSRGPTGSREWDRSSYVVPTGDSIIIIVFVFVLRFIRIIYVVSPHICLEVFFVLTLGGDPIILTRDESIIGIGRLSLVSTSFFYIFVTKSKQTWESVRRNSAPATPATPASPANIMKLHRGSLFTNRNSLYKRICDIWTWPRLSRSSAVVFA